MTLHEKLLVSTLLNFFLHVTTAVYLWRNVWMYFLSMHAIISLSVVPSSARDLNSISLPVGSNCAENHISSVAGLTYTRLNVSFFSGQYSATITSHSLHNTIHHGRRKYISVSTRLPSDIYKTTSPNDPFNGVIYWDQSSSFKLHSEPQNSFNFLLVLWMSKWTTTMPSSSPLCSWLERLTKAFKRLDVLAFRQWRNTKRALKNRNMISQAFQSTYETSW